MRLLILAFLLVAVAAAAAPADHTSVETTSCWDCHAPGRWVPALEPPELADYRFEPAGDAWELVAVLDNPWLHDLERVFGVVSGLDAAGLLPVEGQSTTIQRTGSVQAQVLEAGPATITLDLPNGTQAVRVQLESDDMHDLELVVRPGGQSPWGSGTYGPRDVAAAGWSGWVFEVHRQDVLPGDADFELRVEADASAQPGGWLAAAPPAPPHGQTEIRWPVTASAGQGELAIAAFMVVSYVHDDPSNPDVEPVRVDGVAPYRHEGAPGFAMDAAPTDLGEDVPGFAAAGIPAVAIMAWLRRP